MRGQPRREFTLVDAMVLVAATAFGFAWCPRHPVQDGLSVLKNIRRVWSTEPGVYQSLLEILYHLEYLLRLPMSIVAFWTMALAGLRLLPPRSRSRQLAREAGTVACWVASFVLLIEVSLPFFILCNLQLHLMSIFYLPDNSVGFWHGTVTPKVGFAVAAAWLALVLSGRWRVQRDWIDRMGRILGVIWIGSIPFYSWFVSSH